MARMSATTLPSTAGVATGASTPAFAPSTDLCINGCGKKSNRIHTCPVCVEQGVVGSQFCGPSCYRENYKAHKAKYHKKPAPKSTYNFPEGTRDPYAAKGYAYSGTLRPVMPIVPVPKRAIPSHIDQPDYARNVKGDSFLEIVHYTQSRPQCEVLDAKGIAAMRKVCKLGREVLDIAAAMIKPGVTTLEIDAVVHEECMKRDSYPSPLGYRLFPRSVCTSVNEVICHGIPDMRPLEDGDIINLDVSLYHGGHHADLNATYPVGTKVSDEKKLLMKTARKCLDEAIRICKPGMEYGKLGAVIERVATAQGFSTNRDFVGHGVNRLFHCSPDIAHYANNRTAGKMKVGQTFTIEPMICIGRADAGHWPDKWTATTPDGKASAQFEETLLVTPTGIEVLTAAPGWSLSDPDA